MADDWLRGNPARLFLTKVGDGPPAAIGALIMGADIPGIYVMATQPEWGRQGLGKAVMARMVSAATAEGHTMLILTAGDMGYGLYKKFGFEHIFNYKLFGVISRT
jgi:GNAT superfamily N-acetyltransferase